MKRKITLVLLSLVTFASVGAQSVVSIDGRNYDFIFSWKSRPVDAHWTGIGFAFNDVKGSFGKGSDLILEKSYSFTFNIADYMVPLGRHWLVATGFGLDFSRFHFKGDGALQDVDGLTQYVPFDREDLGSPKGKYKYSKLETYYITLPLILEYQTRFSGGGEFFINAGVEGMVKFRSKSQAKIYDENGKANKVVFGRGLNIPPVNMRFIAKVGFELLSVYATYQPISLFRDGRGPEVYPWQIGLMINI